MLLFYTNSCLNENFKYMRYLNGSSGFDLTTRDSYSTILVEVFTNLSSEENTYLTNHLEWTEHKMMGF